MKFKTFQLIIEGQAPSKSDLQKIIDIGQATFRPGVELFEIEKAITEDRFFWMSCQYDNAELWTDHVWNTPEEKKEANPRKKIQIECRQQLFICFDIKQQLLYMSNMDKRPFLKNYLQEMLQKEVVIKNIIKSLDEFQGVVKSMKSAKFVQVRNIFNCSNASIFARTADIYGMDAPERIILKADYGNTPIAVAKGALQNLEQKLRAGEFESIIIVGEDDGGIEQSFDFSSIISTIPINAIKDDNGHYKPEEVQTLFLSEIR